MQSDVVLSFLGACQEVVVLFFGPASWLVAVCVDRASLVRESLDFVYFVVAPQALCFWVRI